MAYSELIKNFSRIRDYMRQFYLYGFKSRTQYHKKSVRSYDNERRRIESWLGDFMRFRCILSAIRHKRWLQIRFTGHNGKPHSWRCIPYKLEYSSKDDKFRLISANQRDTLSINLARIQQCFMLEPYTQEEYQPRTMQQRILVLELKDERNALERALLHFSHLNKETERMGEDLYQITLFYEQGDEAELLIRVLSFGPVLKVIHPGDFREKLVQRLTQPGKPRRTSPGMKMPWWSSTAPAPCIAAGIPCLQRWPFPLAFTLPSETPVPSGITSSPSPKDRSW